MAEVPASIPRGGREHDVAACVAAVGNADEVRVVELVGAMGAPHALRLDLVWGHGLDSASVEPGEVGGLELRNKG